MRFRQRVEHERIPLSLMPTLGVAMLLWIVCLLSLRGAGSATDLRLQPPQLATAAERTEGGRSLPIHVRLRAGGDGRLAGIVLGQQSLASLAELQQHLRQVVADHRGADAATAYEVELAFDDQLKYQYLMDAMTAISGYSSSDGRRTVKLIDNIKFAAP
jgi:biopolymer transport protein ExbD